MSAKVKLKTTPQRSRIMRAVKSSNTKPELKVRSVLRELRVGVVPIRTRLPGSPDILLRKTVAIFVHGCFWHGCSRHYRPPKSNAWFWRRKLEGNMARDRRVQDELLRMGYRVLVIWEHALDKDGFDRRLSDAVNHLGNHGGRFEIK